MLTIRIRHAGGTLRVENASPTWTFTQLKSAIREKLHLQDSIPILLYTSPPSSAGAVAFVDDTLTLQQAGLQHGAMLFVDHTVLPATITTAQAPSTSKTIDVHGNLVASSKSHTGSEFRPGLLSLRDQKLHWTLTEMTELDDNYTFVIKGKEPNYCSQVSLDYDSAQDFQRFCSVENRFQKLRCSLLFGRFVDNDIVISAAEQERKRTASQYGQTKGKMRVRDLKTDDEEHDLARQRVEVEFFFDPEMSHEYRINFEAESFKDCTALAAALGMQCVGIIFSHAKRTNTFDSREILLCGEACLEAVEGKVDSPFVICKVCPDEQGLVQMDAYQLTKTCLEMQREEALLAMEGGGVSSAFCAVDEKFTVMIEAKPSEVVDCDYFIKRVPIQSHKSSLFTLKFPREHRGDPKWSGRTLKSMVDKLGPRSSEWCKVLRDFHLLFFLTKALGVETVVEICHEITATEDDGGNFPEGFALMVREACNS